MNFRNCFRLLIPALGIAASAVLGQGCSSNSGAPYHMYDSPLLEGRVESRYPRSRTYDLGLGDHTEPKTYYAANDSQGGGPAQGPAKESAANQGGSTEPAGGESREIAQAAPSESTASPKPPALSTRRQAPTQAHKGAPASDETDSGASSDVETTEAPVDDSGPALAADYVWSVYKLNGVTFSSAARRSLPKLFRECKDRGKIYHSSRPAIGDIVFFHNTGDHNDDGRNNDWYTHAAIVEAHGDGGRITLLGYRGEEVERFVMDLESPDAAKTRHGEVANAQLRAKRAQDPPFTQYLAGQLFAGTCSVLGDRSQIVVVDNWKPGMELEP
ncbi:hypothetical protein FIV42_25755 [Persicimonas caeni]|uniref:CHAP domain-containing protein n=1 Tax=Persicimonas caeni TaxID=2292766 RepID=A0A4Y6Q0B7_PERCE|nr:hypothetical protein [Persicimonas caeni]QDG54021.1 hypothetical protein FIV42_25755 [Persicimonas caeni]QED35242.1 hypothetical protein FRD00_25750 [Persicimonas caeni]